MGTRRIGHIWDMLMAMPYVVYILRCADGTLYTGITNDLARRFAQHKSGKAAAYTAAHPVKNIAYTEECASRGAALKREAEIKSWDRAKKLALIAGAKKRR